ncbi:MAG: hypothetical protein VX938_10950, partial [Myxococcota bacterium]|nr:hypothetical protein [Myxococcota bacterium]
LSHPLGDRTDWKAVTPRQNGTGHLILRFGDPFRGRHELDGFITVFDKDASQQARQQIEANVVRYDVKWPVVANNTYLVQVEATAGRAEYELTFVLSESSDPCASVICGADAECSEGRCIPIGPPPGTCSPACRRGLFCVEGRCEPPCKDGCARGQQCNRRANRCVADPCYKKVCGSGKYCQGGTCRTRSTPKPRGCDPPCGDDETCKNNRCQAKPLGPIQAKIVQAIPQGKKTQLILNKGREHKVQVGQKGKIKGVGTFTITELFQFRCKAMINKPATALGNAKTATIFR